LWLEGEMAKFVIEGGSRLQGEVTPSGNKNEVLPALAASLLTDEEVVLENCPHLRDVVAMCNILQDIGVEVQWLDEHRIRVKASRVTKTTLSRELCGQVRASVLFAGPMLARQGEVVLPPPGGDVIGRRKLDTHFLALQALGVNVSVGDLYRLSARKINATEIFLEEASVTATENVLMACALIEGTTIIENAACEPHVQGLCRMLCSMGAEIEGIGTNMLVVRGKKKLSGTVHRIGADYIETGSFIGLSAILGDGVVIHDADYKTLRKIVSVFGRLGISTEFYGNDCFVPGRQRLQIRPDMHGQIPQVDDAPWPQFPTDLMSIAIVVATQAEGSCLFFEKMFEGRMFFVDSLINMGASIILCDPHRVVVVGPSRLYGGTLRSPDIRAGMALLIACMAASGRSVMHNIEQIDRGYERVDEKIRKLGGKVERVEG